MEPASLAGARDLAAVPVTVVSYTSNLGFPAAINQGLQLAVKLRLTRRTETGTGTVLTAIHRSGINLCYAKNSESSTGGYYLSRPEPISRRDADVPQAVRF
jgi:hypothetical protein